jgi:hypothetical protein
LRSRMNRLSQDFHGNGGRSAIPVSTPHRRKEKRGAASFTEHYCAEQAVAFCQE